MGAFALLHLLILSVIVGIFWVLPIILGIQAAQRKNYSPHWMWFGIHPIAGWIACIVLLCLPSRIRCPNCGGYVKVYFRICPYCHTGLDSQVAHASQPPSP